MPLADARLRAIINMLPGCDVIADIGADHGRLGAQLLIDGVCRRVWFTDISEKSLDKARALIKRLALEERACFFVGDGAKALNEAPDAAVIAGMGGATIADIIEGAPDRLPLVAAQPNVGLTELRARASKAGYVIINESLARAGGRFYVAIALARGESAYTKKQLIAGPVLLSRADEEFIAYARFRLRVVKNALAGARKGTAADTRDMEEEIDIWRQIIG